MINKRPGQYIYSYDYNEDESWMDLSLSDGVDIQTLDSERLKKFMIRDDVQEEIEETATKVASLLDDHHIFFSIIADTHYVKNGNWLYTASTIEAVNNRIEQIINRNPEAIIHLGDFTDGLLSKSVCHEYSHEVIDRLYKWNCPVVIALGNHDSNYFKKNPEVMSDTEQWDMYISGISINNTKYDVDTVFYNTTQSNNEKKALWYRIDFKNANITFMVLSAYDINAENRYGYSDEEVGWVERELNQIEPNNKVIFISHDAPLNELDYWAAEIRNGMKLCDIIDAWNVANNHRVIGFIHGHTHADYCCYKRSFPIVSVGCSKIEYFEDKKPLGAICQPRYEDEVSQELWDTLVVDKRNGDMRFIRFGAGFDRVISYDERINRHTIPKVWAHRGASGYAPENTIEAFKLAIDMGADGIELDVQYTKDRKLIIIHDEMVDRTSNGHGYVYDYTLAQLRELNFNKTHPNGYNKCYIPTLNEVLDIIKDTNLMLNIEIKNGKVFYPGIEQDVVDCIIKYDMIDRAIISSFNHEAIRRIKEYNSRIKCGFLYSDGIVNPVEYAIDNKVEALHPSIYNIRYPGVVDRCKKCGVDIHVWTVNSVNELLQMQQYGVDAVITNYPKLAKDVYAGNIESLSESELQNKQVKTCYKNSLLHFAGNIYKYIRRPFVAVDRAVQKAASK